MKPTTNIVIGLDHGAGDWKVFGPHGGIELPSSVATNGRTSLGKVAGLRSRKPPLCVETANGAFYVGREAHTWGRPQENLDDIRFAGSPEAVALMNGAFTLYAQHYGPLDDPLTVYVGVPQEAIIGDKAKAIPIAIKKWLTGTHTWHVDDQPYTIVIEKVLITSQRGRSSTISWTSQAALSPRASISTRKRSASSAWECPPRVRPFHHHLNLIQEEK